jgi:adenylyltransferase/sulfurtransferase
MFSEHDAEERLPKAVACKNRIAEINSEIAVEAEIADVNFSNIERLIKDCDVVIDGTDNFSTRYLINDACVKRRVNWIYGAAVSSYGVTMTILPKETPCLRCVFEEMPPAGSAQTCDTAGIIMPIVSVIAAMQVSEALKLLTGKKDKLHRSLMQFDVWQNEWRKIKLNAPREDCQTCAFEKFETLDADAGEFVAVLCGRDAVQISPPSQTKIDLQTLAEKLQPSGEVKVNPYLLRFRQGDYELTVFQDARAIVKGADDVTIARSLYAKFIGS